jgi:hypothetical protein
MIGVATEPIRPFSLIPAAGRSWRSIAMCSEPLIGTWPATPASGATERYRRIGVGGSLRSAGVPGHDRIASALARRGKGQSMVCTPGCETPRIRLGLPGSEPWPLHVRVGGARRRRAAHRDRPIEYGPPETRRPCLAGCATAAAKPGEVGAVYALPPEDAMVGHSGKLLGML